MIFNGVENDFLQIYRQSPCTNLLREDRTIISNYLCNSFHDRSILLFQKQNPKYSIHYTKTREPDTEMKTYELREERVLC